MRSVSHIVYPDSMTTITFRIDSELEEVLAELMSDGSDRSTVIREALRFAWWERRRRDLLAESEAIAADADDVTEVRAVAADMEPLRAW